MSASSLHAENPALETALDLASRGYPVLPVLANSKRPAILDWPNKATTDPDQLRRWFAEGTCYLVGMVTGPRSGVDVLDIDPNGDSWLAEHKHLIPVTRRQTTRRGGQHFFFKHNPGLRCSEGKVAPGVDVRTTGGYVIVWAFAGLPLIDVVVAEWPAELLQLIIAAAGRSPSSGGDVALQRRLPPSAAHLVETLNRMPNPPETSRSTYIEVMLAAQGCITALEQAGILTDEDRNGIADAAIAWAERWEGYQGTDERTKWHEDWSQHGGDLAGWQTIERIAGQLIPTYRAEQAKAEFEADPIPEIEQKPSRLILDRQAPLTTARKFVKRFYTGTLHHHRGCFYRWTGTHYPKDDAGRMRAEIYNFLGSAYHRTEEGLEPFCPNRSRVDDVIDALKAVTNLPEKVCAPAWLGSQQPYPAAEILICENGLLHMPTQTLLPHTPEFFCSNAIGFAYDRDAAKPAEWIKFLSSLWDDDPQSIEALQEMFGLLLTADTSYQKAFLLVGPKRSGKGTIARVLTELLGRENVANPTLSSLSMNFGLAPLIDKRAAIISDARLGAKVDQSVITERLLSITGEDGQTIDRKYLPAWTGTLTSRVLILTNELPRLTDSSGALSSRFIIVLLSRSFFGCEDRGLTKKLLAELPGILNWAIEGWQRLQRRGYFVQPARSEAAARQMDDLVSPIGAFIRDQCEVHPVKTVSKDDLYFAWKVYCERQGRAHPGTKATFGRDLIAAVPELTTIQPRDEDGRQHRTWNGIGLSSTTG